MKKKTVSLMGLGLLFLFYLLYLKSLAPTIYWDDSGELIASAATMGVPHPTGYPLYALVAQIFSLLPLGSLAWRVNLFSSLCSAATIYLVWHLSRRICFEQPPLLAAVPAMFLGFSPVLWHNGTIAEVYAFNLFLVCLFLLFISFDSSKTGMKLLMFFAGLSVGNHLTLALFLPAVFFFCWDFKPIKFLLTSGLFIFMLMGGLYLYIPLRAVSLPYLNWGMADNWGNFFALVRGAEFTDRMFKGGIVALLGRGGSTAALFFSQFQLGLILGLVGMVVVCLRRPKMGIFLHLAFWGVTLFTLGYDITPLNDWRAYFLPAWLILSLFIAYALAYFSPPKKVIYILLALPLVTALNKPSFNLHRSEFAPYRDAGFILNQLPANSLVVNHDSTRTFSLMYLTRVEGRKASITLLYAPLLNYDWFLRDLKIKGVTLPASGRSQLSYRNYLTSIALTNGKYRPVFGFDWWAEFFNDLIPQGPLFKIMGEGENPGQLAKVNHFEQEYFDYVVKPARTVSPQLKEVLSVHYARLGGYLQRQQQLSTAIYYFKRSLIYNPQQAALSNNLAICLENSSVYDEAIAQYQKTIKMRPDFTSPYGNLARLYYKLGQQAKAISTLTLALEINPRGEYTSALRSDLFKIKSGAPLE